jgi:ribosomal protein S15
LAQARQRKAVNVRRQEELRKEREEALGNPVRGITTTFVESFDTAGSSVLDATSTDVTSESTQLSDAVSNIRLNHFLSLSELEQSLQHSYNLTQPLVSKVRDLEDPALEAEEASKHAEDHQRATAALARIVSLVNASQKDRTRANILRCIDTFGRHNTDSILRPRAPPADTTQLREKTLRAGPDTGSSEVQIAILTAKIRALANHLEAKGGHKDKINKRNLRVLVHKRQKLLAYLRKKERGSDRWQNVIKTLGLTEGTWKGEISL